MPIHIASIASIASTALIPHPRPARRASVPKCLALLCLAGLLPPAWAQGSRPNIVFLFSDDHAYQAVSAYGSSLNKTPNIDKLAQQGMLFKRAYVTNSLCGPSRAVIQTGKYGHVNGFRDNHSVFDGSQPTFPKYLRNAGYQTAVIGKWHLESAPQGFDYWDVLPGQGAYYNPETIRNGVNVKNAGYNTDLTTDLGLQWMRSQRDKTKPFMLMLQYKAPHRKWEPGPGELALYRSAPIPEPATLFDDYATRGSAARLQTMNVSRQLDSADLKLSRPYGLTPAQFAAWDAAYAAENKAFAAANPKGDDLIRWKYQRYLKDYLRCVAGVDKGVGRVLDFLDSAGLSGNTLVIYASDQGFYLGEHGWFDKRFMYEESLRTPFLARWPGVIKPGSVDTSIVSNLDFAETFLDAAGTPVPADMQGASLMPIFKGAAPATWRKSFYYQYSEFPSEHNVYRHYGVTTGRYKLIHYHDVEEWEFYDLKYDPAETRNQYHVPAHQGIIASLKEEIARQRTTLKVPAETPWPTAVPKTAYAKLSSPIPKPGCMDRKYREFDAEADTPLAGACREAVGIRNAAHGAGAKPGFEVRGGRIAIFNSMGRNPYPAELRTLDGRRILQKTVSPGHLQNL